MTPTLIIAIGLVCIIAGSWLGIRAAADGAVRHETEEAIILAEREDNRQRAIAAAQVYDELELSRILEEDGFGVLPVQNDNAPQIECCPAMLGGGDVEQPQAV